MADVVASVTFSDDQSQVLQHEGSALVVGPPGCGKTLLLIEKAARLAQAAEGNEEIAILGFSWRSVQFIKGLFSKRYPKLVAKVSFVTIKDLAQQALEVSGEGPVLFADNARVRQLVQEAIQQEGFNGSLTEGESIIRAFRSQLKNPQETTPHYNLFNRYRQLIDQTGMLDRHTIIRKHILGIDNGTAPLAHPQVMLVDNVQDATPLQQRWLQAHLMQGRTLVMTGNDDLTAFGQQGSMGAKGIQKIEGLNGITRFNLKDNYRTPTELLPAIGKLPRLLRDRLPKQEKIANDHHGQLQVHTFGSSSDELDFLVPHLQELVTRHPRMRIGIITRQHEQASRLTHLLRLRGVKTASYARLVWENRGARAVLDLLYVILNQAETSQLLNVMAAFGVPVDVQAQLVNSGLDGKGWLAQGAPLPEKIEGDVQALSHVRRTLLSSWQLLQGRHIRPPEAFKSLVHDVLGHLGEEDRRYALLGLDMLLSVQGKLRDILPNIQKETLPDMASRIVVAPVTEVRNMEFGAVFMPFAKDGHWPFSQNLEVGMDADHERRLFYLAASRTKGDLIMSAYKEISPFVQEMQTGLKTYKKPKA